MPRRSSKRMEKGELLKVTHYRIFECLCVKPINRTQGRGFWGAWVYFRLPVRLGLLFSRARPFCRALICSRISFLRSARIAGHSSITITQRYVAPQADAIERAFAQLGSTNVNMLGTGENSQVGTKLGTGENSEKSDSLQIIGAKGGTRTPTVLPARS